jgi:hypothetical protein
MRACPREGTSTSDGTIGLLHLSGPARPLWAHFPACRAAPTSRAHYVVPSGGSPEGSASAGRFTMATASLDQSSYRDHDGAVRHTGCIRVARAGWIVRTARDLVRTNRELDGMA